MNTRIIKITDPEKQTREIEYVGRLLRDGELAAIPTETVYGLAANTFDPDAVGRIFTTKGRPSNNPLIVHISDLEMIDMIAGEFPEKARRLAEKYWPGPLTIILPKKDSVPEVVSPGLTTVAIRMPSHPVARAVIKAAGVPLAAPSANISGFPSPTRIEYVTDDLNGRVPVIVDGGQCEFGIESTVVTLATPVPRLLRPGAVTLEDLKSVLGEVEVDNAVLNPLKKGEKAASPGMMYKHYSPLAQLSLVRGELDDFIRYCGSHASDADYALCFEGEEDKIPLPCVTFGKENDPLSQAQVLFDSLRELDARGAKKVFVRSPSAEGVGLGVCNRLYRACGFRFLPEKKGRIFGITGGSGSGKSTVCEILARNGCYIADTDMISRETTRPGSKTLEKLTQVFGKEILTPEGALDRRKLADICFASPEKTEILTSVTHPPILAETLKRCKKATEAGADAVIDAPLLFSSGLDRMCYATIRVDCPEEIRLERIMKRDGISEESAKLRFSKQKTEAEKALAATYTVRNYPPHDIKSETEELLKWMQKN